jgi:hypothetical protein
MPTNNGFTICIYDESWANSDTSLFRGKPLHHVSTSRTSEISYVWIRLFIDDITVV